MSTWPETVTPSLSELRTLAEAMLKGFEECRPMEMLPLYIETFNPGLVLSLTGLADTLFADWEKLGLKDETPETKLGLHLHSHLREIAEKALVAYLRGPAQDWRGDPIFHLYCAEINPLLLLALIELVEQGYPDGDLPIVVINVGPDISTSATGKPFVH